jgi:O-antigen/teichoic acid export membrane protein
MSPASGAVTPDQPVATVAPPPARPAGRGLGRDFAITLLTQVAVALGGLFLYRLLAMKKGAGGMASYALVKQVTLFMLPAVMLGLQTGVPRYVALGREQRGAAEGYLLSAFALTCLSTGVIATVLLISPTTTASVLFGDAKRTYLVTPLVLTLVATLAFEVTYGYYRGRARFVMVSAARALGVAAFPVVLLLVVPGKPIGHLISLMAAGALCACVLLAAVPVARALRHLRPRESLTRARTLLGYGARRIPGEYAGMILLTVPPVLAAHLAPLREVAWLTAGMYVITVITIAFNPVGVVFLPLLARLQKDDFETARRVVGRLAACALHIAMFVTPQLLLFADVAVRAWLGPDFDKASGVIRITVFPIALYVFVLVLRSALDAAAVKAYNSRNSAIALAVAATAAAISLGLDIGRPIMAIAASFALGIITLGALTLGSVHALYRIGTSEYAIRVSLALSAAGAGAGALVRVFVVGSDTTLPSILAVAALELCLAALYVLGLTKAGVKWPATIRDRMLGRA